MANTASKQDVDDLRDALKYLVQECPDEDLIGLVAQDLLDFDRNLESYPKKEDSLIRKQLFKEMRRRIAFWVHMLTGEKAGSADHDEMILLFEESLTSIRMHTKHALSPSDPEEEDTVFEQHTTEKNILRPDTEPTKV